MAEGTPIAKAYVQIRPDLSAFRDELRAGLQGATDGLSGTVRINADVADARAKIDDTKARVDDLSGKTATAKVDANTSDARAKLLEVQTRIDELQTEAALIRVNVDDTASRQKIAAIRDALDTISNETLRPKVDPGRLEELNADLDGLDVRLHNVGQDIDDTNSKFDNFRAKTDGAAKSFSGPGGLVAALIALSPALETVGAVGVGAGAALGVAFGSAAVGLGAFALAAKGSLKEVKGEVSDMTATWQEAMLGFTDAPIKTAVADLPQMFQLLTPSVAGAGQALLGFENNLHAALDTSAAQRFATYLGGEGEAAISTFGNALINVGKGFSGLAEGLAPEISRIETDVDHVSAAFARWGQSAANGGIQPFINYIQQNGPLLAHTLEDIGTDFGILVKDAAPLGPLWLHMIDDIARFVGAVDRMNPELVEWGVGLASVAVAANKLTSLAGLGGLVGVAKGIGPAFSVANDAFKVGATGMFSLAGAASPAAAALLGIGLAIPGLDIGVAALAGNLLLAGHSADTFADGVTKVSSSWGQNFVNSLPAGANAVQAVRTELTGLQTQLGTLQNAESAYQKVNDSSFEGWNKSIGTLSTYGGAVGRLAQDMLSSGVPATTSLNAATAGLQRQYEPLKQKIGELNGLLPNLTAAQNAQNTAVTNAETAMGTAAGYTGSYATQYGILAGDLQKANTQLQTAESLLQNLLNMQLSAAQATTGFYSAVQNLTSSLKTNHTSMDESTAAGLANHQALEQVGQSIIGVISSMEKQGATSDQVRAKVHDLTGYLLSQAGQYGLTTGQVEAYLAQLGLTPDKVATDIVLSGVQAAQDAVARIANQIDHLPTGKTIQVTVAESFFQGIAQSAPGARSNTGSGVSGNNSGIRLSNSAVGGTINRSGRGFRASSASVVGEDGSGFDEYVIPTNPAHRQNALALTRGLLGDLGMMAAGGVLAHQPTVTDDLTLAFGVTGGINNLAAWLAGVEGAAAATGRSQLQAQAAAFASAGGPTAGSPASANAALGQQMAAARGWTGAEWAALNQVAMMESGWSMTAANPTSNARGIAQFINGYGEYYTYGGDPNTAAGQITAFLNYIAGRYGDPIGALNHENAYHWYDSGGILPPGKTVAVNGTGQNEFILTASQMAATNNLVPLTDSLTAADGNLIAALLHLNQVTGEATTGVNGLATAVAGSLNSAVTNTTSNVSGPSGRFGTSPVLITGTVGGGVTQTSPGTPVDTSTGGTSQPAPSVLQQTLDGLQNMFWQWNFTNGKTLPSNAASQLVSLLTPAISQGVPFGLISNVETSAMQALAGGDSGPVATELSAQIQQLINVIQGLTGHGTTVVVNDSRTVQVGQIASPSDVQAAIDASNQALVQQLAVAR